MLSRFKICLMSYLYLNIKVASYLIMSSLFLSLLFIVFFIISNQRNLLYFIFAFLFGPKVQTQGPLGFFFPFQKMHQACQARPSSDLHVKPAPDVTHLHWSPLPRGPCSTYAFGTNSCMPHASVHFAPRSSLSPATCFETLPSCHKVTTPSRYSEKMCPCT